MASVSDDKYTKGVEIEITKNRVGIIRYRGPVDGKKGEFFGIELTKGTGKHSGIFQGKRYFTCKQNRGIFIKRSQIRGLLRFPSGTSLTTALYSLETSPSTPGSSYAHVRKRSSITLRSSIAIEEFDGLTLSPTSPHHALTPSNPLSNSNVSKPNQRSKDKKTTTFSPVTKSNGGGSGTVGNSGGSGKWKPPEWMHKAQPSMSNFLKEKNSNRGKFIHNPYNSRSKSNKSSNGPSTRHSPHRSRAHRTVRSDGRFDFRRYELDNLRSQALYYEQQLFRFQEERRR